MIAADSLGIGRKVDPLTLTITLTASLALVGVDLRDALRDIVGRGK